MLYSFLKISLLCLRTFRNRNQFGRTDDNAAVDSAPQCAITLHKTYTNLTSLSFRQRRRREPRALRSCLRSRCYCSVVVVSLSRRVGFEFEVFGNLLIQELGIEYQTNSLKSVIYKLLLFGKSFL